MHEISEKRWLTWTKQSSTVFKSISQSSTCESAWIHHDEHHLLTDFIISKWNVCHLQQVSNLPTTMKTLIVSVHMCHRCQKSPVRPDWLRCSLPSVRRDSSGCILTNFKSVSLLNFAVFTSTLIHPTGHVFSTNTHNISDDADELHVPCSIKFLKLHWLANKSCCNTCLILLKLGWIIIIIIATPGSHVSRLHILVKVGHLRVIHKIYSKDWYRVDSI